MNNIQKAFRDKGRLGLRQGMAGGGIAGEDPRRAAARRQIEADAEFERQEAAKRAPVAPSPVIRSPAVPAPAAPPPAVAPVPVAPAVVAPVRAAPMGNQEVINRRMRDAGLRRGGVVPGHDLSGSDDVPVNLTRGEGVLPVKTVDALGGPAVIEHLIEATTGEKPKTGLRAGGKYADGALDWLRNAGGRVKDGGVALVEAVKTLGDPVAKAAPSTASPVSPPAAPAAAGVRTAANYPGLIDPSKVTSVDLDIGKARPFKTVDLNVGNAPRLMPDAVTATENARNAQAAIDATQRLGASAEGAGLRAAAPTAAEPSRTGSLVKGSLALAPVVGAAQAVMDSPQNVQKLGESIGVDTDTNGGKVVANAVNALDKTGDAATFGLAGRYGQALAAEAENGPPTLATPIKAAWNTGAGLRGDVAKWWEGGVKPAAAAAPAARSGAAGAPGTAAAAAANTTELVTMPDGSTRQVKRYAWDEGRPLEAAKSQWEAEQAMKDTSFLLKSGTGAITNNSTGKVAPIDTRGIPAKPSVDMNDYSRPIGLAAAAGAPKQDNMPSSTDTWDDMWRKKAGRAQEREGLRAETARYTADSSAAARRYGADIDASTSRANSADTLAGRKYNTDSTARTAAATNQRQAENDNVKRNDETIKNMYPVTDDMKSADRPAQEAARNKFNTRLTTTLGNMGVRPEQLSHAGLSTAIKLSKQMDAIEKGQAGAWQAFRRLVGLSNPRAIDDDLRHALATGDMSGLINNRYTGAFGDVEQGALHGGPGALGTGVTDKGRLRDIEAQKAAGLRGAK